MKDESEYADPARYVELVGFDTDWRDTWWRPDFLALMARRWGVDAIGEMLDVGCGAGHWSWALLPHLPSTVRARGVDREGHFVELARAQAARRGYADRTTFEVRTAEALAFPDDSFDLVTCQTVLIHVADAQDVLREMVRVLRPGGLLVTAEPDNLASTASFLNDSVSTSADLGALFELKRISEIGKRALGEGDDSIGGRLPGLFTEIGLEDVDCALSDNPATLVPPYTGRHQALDMEQQVRWAGEDVLFATRNDLWRHFAASGGDRTAFDALWAHADRWLRGFEAAAADGTYHGARGHLFYLVSGRKPQR